LDIEEHQLRCGFVDQRQGTAGVVALSHDGDVGMLREPQLDTTPRQWLIIHDDGAYRIVNGSGSVHHDTTVAGA
jgi:hypothetical protein